ncbi:MAG: ThuA domain-containing protein [bacterium]
MKIWIVCAAIVVSLSTCKKSEKQPLAGSDMSQILTLEEIEKIIEAVPEQPAVQPKKPRKLLVFSLSWGYKHDAIAWGREMFRIMAKKTGAFEAVFSEDVAMFEPKNLNQFDAVLFNNTNNEIFLPENFDSLSTQQQAVAKERDEALKNSFVNFLSSGKGLAVIHAGVASFREWSEFGEIIGARFDNHSWNVENTVFLRKEEPGHPLVQAFPDEPFEVKDEIYQMKGPYSRDRLKVLLRLDTTKTDMDVANVHRTDGDFAISWIKQYGKGRVFYCALGHYKHIFWDRAILRHFLDGIQFTLGDLDCDATPSAKVSSNHPIP